MSAGARPAEQQLLLTITAFSDGGRTQLCGPAMIKTASDHTITRVQATFCRWASLQTEHVTLRDTHGRPLKGESSVAASGLSNGSALTALLAPGAAQPSPSACSAPFAMLDVLDSELGAAADSLLQVR